MQSPAGKRFLESAPIPVDKGAPISPPLGRILWSVQVGLVIAMAGLGLFIVSSNIEREVAQPIFSMGVLALSVGSNAKPRRRSVALYLVLRRE